MEHRLGIVVPAFKERFLARTLNSIASQTDQRFNLYVFDDHSPAPIETLARSARLKQLNYHRFDENLGSKSLVQPLDPGSEVYYRTECSVLHTLRRADIANNRDSAVDSKPGVEQR